MEEGDLIFKNRFGVDWGEKQSKVRRKKEERNTIDFEEKRDYREKKFGDGRSCVA